VTNSARRVVGHLEAADVPAFRNLLAGGDLPLDDPLEVVEALHRLVFAEVRLGDHRFRIALGVAGGQRGLQRGAGGAPVPRVVGQAADEELELGELRRLDLAAGDHQLEALALELRVLELVAQREDDVARGVAVVGRLDRGNERRDLRLGRGEIPRFGSHDRRERLVGFDEGFRVLRLGRVVAPAALRGGRRGGGGRDHRGAARKGDRQRESRAEAADARAASGRGPAKHRRKLSCRMTGISGRNMSAALLPTNAEKCNSVLEIRP
jgi:hypothetical protein